MAHQACMHLGSRRLTARHGDGGLAAARVWALGPADGSAISAIAAGRQVPDRKTGGWGSMAWHGCKGARARAWATAQGSASPGRSGGGPRQVQRSRTDSESIINVLQSKVGSSCRTRGQRAGARGSRWSWHASSVNGQQGGIDLCLSGAKRAAAHLRCGTRDLTERGGNVRDDHGHHGQTFLLCAWWEAVKLTRTRRDGMSEMDEWYFVWDGWG